MSELAMERKENGFMRVVKGVVTFPFKVLWFVVKLAFVLLLAGVLTTVGYCVYRSGQPMMLPEARGMTYRELAKERYESWKALDVELAARRKESKENRHACALVGVFYVNMFVVPVLAFEATVSAIYPDSDFAHVQEAGDHYFYRNVPVGSEPKWGNFLPLLWEAVERQSWTWWAVRTTYTCPTQPVKFPETASP